MELQLLGPDARTADDPTRATGARSPSRPGPRPPRPTVAVNHLDRHANDAGAVENDDATRKSAHRYARNDGRVGNAGASRRPARRYARDEGAVKIDGASHRPARRYARDDGAVENDDATRKSARRYARDDGAVKIEGTSRRPARRGPPQRRFQWSSTRGLPARSSAEVVSGVAWEHVAKLCPVPKLPQHRNRTSPEARQSRS